MFSREVFGSEALIYVPTADSSISDKWLVAQTCVWDGPTCLKKTPCLKDFYPQLDRFFVETLQLADATWSTLLEEARLIEAGDSLAYISQIFVALNDLLAMEASAAHGGESSDRIAQELVRA